MTGINGFDAAEEDFNQIVFLSQVVRSALDGGFDEVVVRKEKPSGTDAILALTAVLGERIAAVPKRQERRLILKEIEKILRETVVRGTSL